MNYSVYKHAFPNGKVYIGITSRKPKRRWNNGNGYLSTNKKGEYNQPLIARAILKYEWNNIQHEILFEELSKEEAEQKEIELIAYYKSNQQDYGYNIANGGNCAGTMSEETKKKISKIHKGKKLSPEHIEKIREASRGRKHTQNFITSIKGKGNPFYGKHHTEETKKKIGKANKGRKQSEETIRKRVQKVKGKKRTKETCEKISKINKGRKRPDLSERNRRDAIPIKCIESGVTYYGQREASRQTGISQSSIGKCLQGKQITAGGYHWEYADNIEANIVAESKKKKIEESKFKQKKMVRCIEDNVTYKSIAQANKITGVAISSISQACNGKLKSAGGYHWEFVKK